MTSFAEKYSEQWMALLKSLTLLEASELVRQIEVFVLSGSVPTISPMTIPTHPDEEKNEFDIEITADKKIAILKVIRDITGLRLKEDKDLLEQGIAISNAEDAKKPLEVGSKVHVLENEKELLDTFASLHNVDFLIKQIDNIFVELTQIDNRIAQSQIGIDDLKAETREILDALRERVV